MSDRLGITDTATISISITGIEIIALKKLVLVSYALAQKLDGAAGREQKALTLTLNELVLQIEAKAAAR